MKLHEIVKFLYEKETITGEEFMQILNSTENSIEEQARQTEEQQRQLLKDAERQAPAEDEQRTISSDHTIPRFPADPEIPKGLRSCLPGDINSL